MKFRHAGPLLAVTLLARSFGAEPYLSEMSLENALKLVPPAPLLNDDRDRLDRTVFKATRSFAGSRRWSYARSDNGRTVADLLKDFSCSTGVNLRAWRYPRLNRLLLDSLAAGEKVANQIKQNYQRPRPFRYQKGPLCLPFAEYRVSAYDYPSGHSTSGWLTALILSDLWPDREGDIVVRAREFAESRVICGVHSLSATEAGEILARQLYDEIKKSPGYRHDFDLAGKELLQKAEASGTPDPGACHQESTALAVSLLQKR